MSQYSLGITTSGATPGGSDTRRDRPTAAALGQGARALAEEVLAAGLADRPAVVRALQFAAEQRITLQEALVSLGLVSEAGTYAALARACDMPLVDLSVQPVSQLAVRLVPEKLARRHLALPLSEDNRTITFAVCHPLGVEAEQDIGFAAGRTPRAVLAPRRQILEGLDRCYRKLADIERLVERAKTETAVEAAGGESSVANATPVVELCNRIMVSAVEARASEIHVEPFAGSGSVRFRVGGTLEPVLTLPGEARLHVTNRFKVLARTALAVRSRPQDGAFRLLIGGRPIDVRLSTVPTTHGERVVLRLVDAASSLQTIDSLRFDPATSDRLKRALQRPDGLVLFSGPPASGKTTTLYAALQLLAPDHPDLVTVEDLVERLVAGVRQIAVNRSAGGTTASTLRTVLEQDPGVVVVGQTAGPEVAQLVVQASYSGRLVLTSIAAPDAAGALSCLGELGLDRSRLAEVLSIIVAQRLIRLLCPRCRVVRQEAEARRLGQAQSISRAPAGEGGGCDACRRTGYAGRVPIAESVVPDEGVRRLIRAGAPAAALREAMRASGFRGMREAALELVEQGLTSLEEVQRVLADADVVRVEPARARKKVLVVDDDRVSRVLVKRLLEKDGHDVVEGENGVQAVELARRLRPDLLVLDLLMPLMDGFQALDRLRRDLTLAALPVVVLTAESGSATERRVLELGADDYLVKPFEPGVLVSRVRAVFRRAARSAA